jgi:hypothetical protein
VTEVAAIAGTAGMLLLTPVAVSTMAETGRHPHVHPAGPPKAFQPPANTDTERELGSGKEARHA